MSKHTPGPWTLDDRGYKFIVSGGDGYITRDVCRMDSSTMAAFAQEANARLIAAAPALLGALKSATDLLQVWIECCPPYDEALSDREVLKKARAAIAKAEGTNND